MDDIPSNSKVLILGGGTGKILPHLKECRVVYVEKSGKMLDRASKKSAMDSVEFVNVDFLDWKINQQFDLVICPFFLDVFTSKNLSLVVEKIAALTAEGGTLIITDFQDTGRPYHQMMLLVMHVFFRIFSNLESRKLGDIENAVLRSGYEMISRRTFHKELVFSAVYQRQ
ncbi:MAG: class I SAM-dependent methyltransferase [Cytophagales bacterium]|nr:class I SAM-dependent methyltransferase [Cytophagales bacterium]